MSRLNKISLNGTVYDIGGDNEDIIHHTWTTESGTATEGDDLSLGQAILDKLIAGKNVLLDIHTNDTPSYIANYYHTNFDGLYSYDTSQNTNGHYTSIRYKSNEETPVYNGSASNGATITNRYMTLQITVANDVVTKVKLGYINNKMSLLPTNNVKSYEPTDDYHPATKKYVDDSVVAIHVPTKTSQLTNDSNYEVNTNKITYINDSSTDDQYPSAKAVYNAINNKVAKDGETIFGWYVTCPEGGNMTELHGFTKSDLNSFQVGDYVEWPSTVVSGAVNGGMIIGNDYSHGYKPEGGRYYIRTIYVGRGSDYSFTYVYDLEGENVYKGTWPDSEGGKACFAGDTLIYTSDGDKAIETLQVGDKVKSANAFLNIIEDRPITKIIEHEANNLVEIITKDDKIITTGDHLFNEKEKGVTPARCLEKGDILDTGDLLGSEVKSVKTLNSVQKVYEIVVEDNHNYYVGKTHILVHNEHLKEN